MRRRRPRRWPQGRFAGIEEAEAESPSSSRVPGRPNHGEVHGLYVLGVPATLFRDDAAADVIGQERHLLSFPGDDSVRLDRFDARLLLEDLRPLDEDEGSCMGLSVGRHAEGEELEAELDRARYANLDYSREHLLENPLALYSSGSEQGARHGRRAHQGPLGPRTPRAGCRRVCRTAAACLCRSPTHEPLSLTVLLSGGRSAALRGRRSRCWARGGRQLSPSGAVWSRLRPLPCVCPPAPPAPPLLLHRPTASAARPPAYHSLLGRGWSLPMLAPPPPPPFHTHTHPAPPTPRTTRPPAHPVPNSGCSTPHQPGRV
jgi:hypothetical protein